MVIIVIGKSSEAKEIRKEAKKVIAEIKQELSTALKQMHTLHSEESTEESPGGSRGYDNYPVAKTNDTSQFHSVQGKSESQEKKAVKNGGDNKLHPGSSVVSSDLGSPALNSP